ncbi:MAG: type II toxin-antitoxin system RelE/ParE family toxin [Acidobacteria bacterium]|nr:type II toxin-antitoxin system RelE/ParE family toxin [Acidobacteriota bacterium]
MPELLLTRRARRDLGDLPRQVQEAVARTLVLVESDPQTAGKPLRGRLKGLWSCRVGNYRVLYTIEGARTRSRIIVRAIRHRAVAYRGRTPRRPR